MSEVGRRRCRAGTVRQNDDRYDRWSCQGESTVFRIVHLLVSETGISQRKIFDLISSFLRNNATGTKTVMESGNAREIFVCVFGTDAIFSFKNYSSVQLSVMLSR